MLDRLLAPFLFLVLSACGGNPSSYSAPLYEENSTGSDSSLMILLDERELELHFGEEAYIELFIHGAQGQEVTWTTAGAPLPRGLTLESTGSTTVRIHGRPRFLGQYCLTVIAQTSLGGAARPVCFFSRARALNGAFY